MGLLRDATGNARRSFAFGLFGVALTYGNGAMTPAISVLSELRAFRS